MRLVWGQVTLSYVEVHEVSVGLLVFKFYSTFLFSTCHSILYTCQHIDIHRHCRMQLRRWRRFRPWHRVI